MKEEEEEREGEGGVNKQRVVVGIETVCGVH